MADRTQLDAPLLEQKSEDTVVDGPKLAAQILSRLAPEQQSKLMQAISEASPQIAQKIEENLFSFEDIADLTPQGLQAVLKEVEHKDLVVSLKTASNEVKKTILQNLSQRKQQMVQEDLAALPPTRVTEVKEAQIRIVRKVDDLRSRGVVRTQSKHDVWV